LADADALFESFKTTGSSAGAAGGCFVILAWINERQLRRHRVQAGLRIGRVRAAVTLLDHAFQALADTDAQHGNAEVGNGSTPWGPRAFSCFTDSLALLEALRIY
jgi:hypothetical protein